MSELLWKPAKERIKNTNLYRYIEMLDQKYGLQFNTYEALYDWSIKDLSQFWATVWEFAGIKYSKPYNSVLTNKDDMFHAKWFEGAQLNFAENLLRFRDDKTALVFKGETQKAVRITFGDLYDQVARLAQSLRSIGVTKKDRVAAFMPNRIATVVAMLAATSIGATWSSCSPDFGIKGVVDRFGQIQPKVLFCADGYFYNGKKINSLGRIREIIKQIPSIQRLVVVPYIEKDPNILGIPRTVSYQSFLSSQNGLNVEFEQVPADHPLYIMYSSGTTGLPKCLVQGTAGILINQLKEQILHTDVKRDDTIFYFTTCGWMMWNWLVSALALGATVVLYDGSPFYPDPEALWKLAQDENITVFGTSAKYLASLEKAGAKPGKTYDLTALKAILSTGSPLSGESFDYVFRDIKQDLQLASISGGTDLNGCFALGNPISPVYRGELQCRGLGMKVEAFDAYGKPVIDEQGELVCTAPFPSQPLYFWNDKDGSKYRTAYFETYPNIWYHGDFIRITPTGGVIIYGRSDATLNLGGVRIGTAEIYRVVETMEEIEDSIIVGQEWDNDVRAILFVKLKEQFKLTDELIEKIRITIRENTTPRHVPAKVIAIDDIPYTINMKKVELAVKNVIHGRPVLNKDALANPEALDLYKDIPELKG
jgi:acetoacetyl-CoA synthetase